MKIRTLLIDGSYLLKRSYHGAKDAYTVKFGMIGGLYGFMIMLRKLIREHKINKVVIAWDGENGGIHRYHIDVTYKANRKTKEWFNKIELTEHEIQKEKEKEESILKQKKRIQAYCEELFIRQIEVDDIEADDIIASYCQKYHKKEEILIYTNDRDFAQLLNLDITILFGNISQPVNRTNYIMHFDHHYSNALTLKIICGDTSDNIDGVGGVKEKTLLNKFPELKYKYVSVNEIVKRSKEMNEERVSNKKKTLKAFDSIINGRKRLITNHKLTDLTNPILNSEAIDEIEQLDLPLSPEGRGSKNLYKMMHEDEFIKVFKGSFVNFIEPFYVVIISEQEKYKNYLKESRK